MTRRNGRSGRFYIWSNIAETSKCCWKVPPKIAGNMAFDQEKARKLIAGAPDQGFVSESDSKEILTAYGLPVIRTQIATTEAQACADRPGNGIPGGHETALTGHHP
jgi:acyl-CoA synthetase (NDP forming)